MNTHTRILIASLALVSLFFVFPEDRPFDSDTGNSLVLLLLASAGILLSRIFVLSSSSMDRTGIEPSVIIFIASLNCTELIYPVTAFFGFTGSLINSLRSDKGIGNSWPAAVYQGISFAFLLKMGGWLFRALPETDSAVVVWAYLTGTALLITILRTMSVHFTETRPGSFRSKLERSIFTNSFILLLAVPGTLSAQRHPNSFEMLLTVSVSLLSMILVHGISIWLNRSAHERTEELETVAKLKELSERLFPAETEMEVLGILCRSLSEAWQCRAAVSWKSLKYFNGETWNTDTGVSISHPDGLTVWVDSYSSTVPDYLESFVNRTVPVLEALDAQRRMKRTSWESVETMVSFIEGNMSEFAGFSRRVAATAEQLSRALKKSSWFCDCMRLAGLLHVIDLPEGEGAETEERYLSIPDITSEALKYLHEHWGGTGPVGKSGEDIPVSARILAVSIAWERASASGKTTAARDLNMRAGTLYDPRLVEILLELAT